ncbi:aspartate aminotransferase family protein [Anaerovorax odorimutans]|uniref:Aspartate aminotransferase family protein n=1 Tax=Anaerovorax odorimutans TaxID=109327 RepID=A0ABT1RP41_9FIRM|nr:aspartate aminotransferase family protein [Anaerovorax odorimutans]MCQ4636963.1 aspartate aminotransferase family protein [Anaerovorax odorimutans]
MKPYEKLEEQVKSNKEVTEKNREALMAFLEEEHPGDVLFTKWDYPQIIKKGKGNRVWDVDGKEYIDCISGMSTMNIGHADPRIAEVLKEQYLELDNWFDFPTPQRIKLVKKLIEITPGDYKKRVRLALSGSDAVELAIRSARYHTKKTHILSFYGAYHGQNTATMGLTGAGGMHRWYNPVPMADHCIERFPYAYCYRCPYDKEYGSCDMHCVKIIDDLMASGQTSLGNPFSGVNNVAAMIVEPMQSSAGYIIPPREFLAELRKLADKYGFLLIFDEIQTGLGRTGTMFASEHSGVAPDITLVGKALGAGVPMSAVVARAEIFEDAGPGFICSTYAGSSLGCAVGNKVIEIIEEDGLIEQCAETGNYLAKALETYKSAHPLVGSYSQTGVYYGIEYVLNRETKEPAVEATAELVNALRDAGLLCQLNGYYNNRLSFIPPINITKENVDEIFEILDKVTSEVEAKL